jgi:flagellar motor switch protein FliN/FliY
MSLSENIGRYKALTFPVEAELGRRTISVRDILALAPGEIIKLSQPIGSKLEILVGGALFGKGELVQLSGKLALKFSGFPRKT